MKLLKLIALLILVPLLMTAFGTWEKIRADEDRADLQSLAANLDESIPKLRQLVAERPMTSVTVGDQKMAATLALSRFESAADEMGTMLALSAVRVGLAVATIALGIIAATIGALALAATIAAGGIARQSRARMLRAFEAGRRLLPYVLVSHIAIIAAAAATIIVFEALGMWHMGRMSSGDFKLLLAGAAIAFGCLFTAWSMFKQLGLMLQMFEPTPMDALGRTVSEAESPALWDYVRGLATRLGALPPDHIVVGLTEGFYVTSHDVLLQPSAQVLHGRTLYLPLPYLATLDRDETSAIIGHELGHFAGADTEYSQRFVPIYDGVSRSLHVVAGSIIQGDLLQRTMMRPAFLFGVFFMEQFDHSVNHWKREREFAADATGVRVSSAEAAGAALVRSVAMMPRIDQALSARAEASDAIAEDAIEQLLRALSGAPLTAPDEHLDERLPHPTDSHPPTRNRIEALGTTVPAVLARGLRPVTVSEGLKTLDDYLGNAAPLRRALSDDFDAHVKAQDQEITELLQAHADAVQDETTLVEGARKHGILMYVFGGFFALVTASMLVFGLMTATTLGNSFTTVIIVAALFGVFSAGLFWRGRHFVRDHDKPLITLTPDHFIIANVADPLPIAHIADMGLQVGNGIRITLTLEPEAGTPRMLPRKVGARGGKFNARKRTLTILMAQASANGERLKPDQLLDLLSNYLKAGQARQILHDRA
ncbi:M48 family metallopeptidase [Schauerella aestuarii]|uniref:M48 family metallopeptidase n=1 Tax=Schauerella aestuarii TaxID=2511204 RepID=UPI0013707EA9|nr:M48 family metallopeptidase [Achromobacter aestuarii]MYZ45278.1 peptidase M48 [Achromobacter aestuarii]